MIGQRWKVIIFFFFEFIIAYVEKHLVRKVKVIITLKRGHLNKVIKMDSSNFCNKVSVVIQNINI